MLKDPDGLTVLDLGCGEGYLSRELVRKGAHVIGIDISEKLIEIAKEKSLKEFLKIDYRLESSNLLRSVPLQKQKEKALSLYLAFSFCLRTRVNIYAI